MGSSATWTDSHCLTLLFILLSFCFSASHPLLHSLPSPIRIYGLDLPPVVTADSGSGSVPAFLFGSVWRDWLLCTRGKDTVLNCLKQKYTCLRFALCVKLQQIFNFLPTAFKVLASFFGFKAGSIKIVTLIMDEIAVWNVRGVAFGFLSFTEVSASHCFGFTANKFTVLFQFQRFSSALLPPPRRSCF